MISPHTGGMRSRGQPTLERADDVDDADGGRYSVVAPDREENPYQNAPRASYEAELRGPASSRPLRSGVAPRMTREDRESTGVRRALASSPFSDVVPQDRLVSRLSGLSRPSESEIVTSAPRLSEAEIASSLRTLRVSHAPEDGASPRPAIVAPPLLDVEDEGVALSLRDSLPFIDEDLATTAPREKQASSQPDAEPIPLLNPHSNIVGARFARTRTRAYVRTLPFLAAAKEVPSSVPPPDLIPLSGVSPDTPRAFPVRMVEGEPDEAPASDAAIAPRARPSSTRLFTIAIVVMVIAGALVAGLEIAR